MNIPTEIILKEIKQVTFINADGNPHTYTRGINCVSITEHRPAGEGDKLFYDIETETEVIRVFNIEIALFEKE